MKIRIGSNGGNRFKRDATLRGDGKKKSRVGAYVSLVFPLFFLGMGAFFLWMVVLEPVSQAIGARDWVAVPCRVLSSTVYENYDSDGSTYRVDISYEYEYQGRKYTSDRYQFLTMSSSGRKSKAKVVAKYPAGSMATCYVNPDAPREAVMHRGLSWMMLFGLIPLVFVIVALVWILAVLTGWTSKKASWATGSAERVDDGKSHAVEWLPKFLKKRLDKARDGLIVRGSETIRSSRSRWTGLFGAVFFMVFWNGIVSVFVYKAYVEDGDWFLRLFVLPFIAVGIGFVCLVIYRTLALSNPVVVMTFDQRVVGLGSTLGLNWTIDGATSRIRQLTIEVEAEEQATYSRGTNTYTDKHEIFSQQIFEETSQDGTHPISREGEVELKIPVDQMHSFESRHNKVVWRVKINGEIPRWPDVSDSYEFAVLPMSVMQAMKLGGVDERGMF